MLNQHGTAPPESCSIRVSGSRRRTGLGELNMKRHSHETERTDTRRLDLIQWSDRARIEHRDRGEYRQHVARRKRSRHRLLEPCRGMLRAAGKQHVRLLSADV